MIKRSLKEIIDMVGGEGLNIPTTETFIEGVSIDTRTISEGQLYVPIVGERFNGHAFLDKAIERGGRATLWNKAEEIPDVDLPIILVEDTLLAIQQLAKEYRNQLSTKVIGITGSNGKTTTKDILAGLLETKYRTHKTIGNLNNHLGLPLTLLAMEEDTEMAVVELGMSNLGEIRLLAQISSLDGAIITNIGEAHLEDLKTKDNIIKAKMEILDGLKSTGLFIYYGDDSDLKKAVNNIEISNETITFGGSSNNNFYSSPKKLDEKGISFTLDSHGGTEFFLPLLGVHQMLNATAAIAMALHFDVSKVDIQKGLLNVQASGMRNELISTKSCTILDDSYKSNPSSLRAAIETIYSLKGFKQKILVLGDMLGIGDDEIQMHRDIGAEINPKEIDYLFTIGPFGRHIYDTAKGNFPEGRVMAFNTNEEIIEAVRRVIGEGSIVLVKASRPMELDKVVDALKAL